MAWGDCWGHSPCNNAKTLAAAFYDGRERKMGRYAVVKKDLHIEYRMYGHAIARRIPDENIPELVRRALLDGKEYEGGEVRRLEFSWAGMQFEKEVARHLRGLGITGVECACKETRYQDQRLAELCGKPVEGDEWYTLEEAAASTLQHPPPRATKQAREKREGFVNLTLPLPGFA